jgi:perosamine synthetase
MKFKNIPLSNPDITEADREEVLGVLNTPNLSFGPKLSEFERTFARYIGSKYAIAVNSGTSGLHLCVRAMGVKEGDRVFTTPFSFVSSANCLLFERAFPIFIDIDEKSLNMDVEKLDSKLQEMKPKAGTLKGLLPVHVFGRPCEMNEIMDIAKMYDLCVIEDACEAIGAEYLTNIQKGKYRDGELLEKSQATLDDKKSMPQGTARKRSAKKIWQKVGTFGACGVFAFYPNKQMTTGEGGMIITDDDSVNELCRSMRNQGRTESDKWLQHERLGYNYRISDLNCALGIAQLARIEKILEKRERIASLYNEKLKNISELDLPAPEKNKKISWFVYVVRLIKKYTMEDRDSVLSKLREKGIGCSNYFTPIHLQPFYRKMFGYKKGDYPLTESISERTIALPFYNNLEEAQISYICETLKEIICSL